jgi:alkylhydroperoxidase family enzyme
MTVVDPPVDAITAASSPVRPLSHEEAAPQVQGVYDTLTHKFGHMPNLFAVMAHHPAALTHFLALYESIMGQTAETREDSPTTLNRRDKELVYMKTAMLNGCEY